MKNGSACGTCARAAARSLLEYALLEHLLALLVLRGDVHFRLLVEKRHLLYRARHALTRIHFIQGEKTPVSSVYGILPISFLKQNTWKTVGHAHVPLRACHALLEHLLVLLVLRGDVHFRLRLHLACRGWCQGCSGKLLRGATAFAVVFRF